MTRTLGTDENNDLYLNVEDNVTVLAGLAAVMAACETASKAQLGEMVLMTGLGIPNFQTVWVGSPNYSLFSSYLRRTLLSVPGVIDVTNLELRALNNVLSYTATIKTEFGTAGING
jgi:hypothetical protein